MEWYRKGLGRIVSAGLAVLVMGIVMKVPVMAADLQFVQDEYVWEEEIPVAETEMLEGSCGENVIWSLDSETGVLTISGTGTMADGTAPWYEQADIINSVVIEDGVTSIGARAFYACYYLTNIDIPSSVTSIGEKAFKNCSSLESISVPSGVTSMGEEAFCGCESLNSIQMPVQITRIATSTFYGCASLDSIEIPAGVTVIDAKAFYGCGSFSSIEIPAGVTDIGANAFRDCSSLSSMKIPAGVMSVGDYLFSGCSSLSSVELPDGITSIGTYAFYRCASLSSIEIPVRVTSIGAKAFYGCRKLSSVEIPAGVTRIENEAFSDCGLTSVKLSAAVQSIGQLAFRGCSDLNSIELPDSVTDIENEAFRDCINLTSIRIPAGIETIGTDAFRGCNKLGTAKVSCGWKDAPLYDFPSKVKAEYEHVGNILYAADDASNVISGKCDACDSVTDTAKMLAPANTVYTGNSIEVSVENTFSDMTPVITYSGSNLTEGMPVVVGNYVATMTLDTGMEVLEVSLDYEIEKAASSCTVAPTAKSLIYNGQAQTLLNAGEANGGIMQYSLSQTGSYSPTIPQGTDAGNYTVYYKVAGDDNHTDTEVNSVTVTIEKADSSCTEAPTAKDLIYTGLAQELINAGTANGGTMQYSLSQDGSFGTDIPQGTDAGDYTVYYKVVGDSNHTDTEISSVTVTIGKAASSCDVAPTAKDLIYTGQAQSLINSGTANNGTMQYSLEENGDYTTNIPQGTDAGEYTVYYKVVGDANYKDTEVNSVSVIMEKAAGELDGSDTCLKTYGDAAFTPDTVANHNETELQYEVMAGVDVISVSGQSLDILKAGEATVKVILPESKNYYATEKIITVNVQKKAGHTVADIDRYYVCLHENADSVDLKSMLPEDCGAVNYSVPQTEGAVTYVTTPFIEYDMLLYTVDVGAEEDQGKIEVVVNSDNYEAFTITVNVKLHDQTPVKVQDGASVALLNDTMTYGETWSVLEFAQTIFTDEEGNVIEGNLGWKTPDERPKAGKTLGIWVFTPNNARYATLEGALPVTVNKAIPTLSGMPVVVERPYHPTKGLQDSDITAGSVSVPGSWSFEKKTVLPVGTHTCVVKFTPEDAGNYETITESVDVTVVKATPYVQTMPMTAPITYGNKLADSQLTGGVVNYSKAEGIAVKGNFAWVQADYCPTVAESNSSKYKVVFTPVDSSNYNSVEIVSGVQVNKAKNAPDMPVATVNVPFSVQKAGEVALPANWKWRDTDENKGFQQGKTITAVAEYVGADKNNYENVTVTVTITRTGKEWIFTDVAVIPGHWKYEAVKYVYENDIMNGISGTTEFRPDIGLNRAMFATVLYRMAGNPQVKYEDVFTDVKDGKYYSSAVLWAKQKGIVSGFSDGSYGVETNITREQIAKMLCEYATKQGYDVSGKASLDSFTDKDSVSGWATGYMQWAVNAGMISGKPNGDGTFRLDPKGNATRAECAKMLKYFMEKYN